MILFPHHIVHGLVTLKYYSLHLILQTQHHLTALTLDLSDHLVVGSVEFFALFFEDFDRHFLNDSPVRDGILIDTDIEWGDVFLELTVEVACVFGEGLHVYELVAAVEGIE